MVLPSGGIPLIRLRNYSIFLNNISLLCWRLFCRAAEEYVFLYFLSFRFLSSSIELSYPPTVLAQYCCGKPNLCLLLFIRSSATFDFSSKSFYRYFQGGLIWFNWWLKPLKNGNNILLEIFEFYVENLCKTFLGNIIFNLLHLSFQFIRKITQLLS